jgi:tRNA nucleotidyltransferase (CCA-adding enzyme)
MWYGSPMTNSYLEKTDAFVASLGVEAYRVGGSVRDELLGRRVKDADYMIRGLDMLRLGMLLADVRRAQGDITFKVIKDRDGRDLGYRVSRKGLGIIEITLPRREVSTGPGHRDFDIVLDPTLTLAEDAKRRDFTFNALYKPPWGGQVVDATGTGLYDLEHKLVRTTHEDSFRDDPLRTLRALRFVSVLGYDLTADTEEQMYKHRHAVNGLKASGHASGTILDEMNKLLMGDNAVKALRLMRDTYVLGGLFPELFPMVGFDQGSRYHDMTTDEHTFQALETAVKIDAPLRVRWALLFHDAGKPATAWTGDDGRKHYYAQKPKDDLIDPWDGHVNMDHEEYSEILWREAAERMNVPRNLREDVAVLVRNHMVKATGRVKAQKVRRARVKFGDSMLRDLHMMRMCDLTGKGTKNLPMLRHVATQEDIRRAAEAARVPASRKDLAIGGRDAMALGFEGPEIGAALDAILDEVVVDPTEHKRSREWQLGRLTKRMEDSWTTPTTRSN